MDFIEKFATTKYGDFKGNVSIDFHGMSEDLFSLCRAKGIDTDIFFPIAFSIDEEDTLGIGHHSQDLSFTIYGVECEKGRNFDQIAAMIDKNNGIANVTTHSFELPFSEIGKYFKRFSLMAVSHMRDHISEIKVGKNE